MFSLTIAFGETPAMWRLLFKTEEAASKALAQSTAEATKAFVSLVDDFGQVCLISTKEIRGLMCEDLEQSKAATIEMLLHDARTRAQANIQARSEPMLRNAGQGQGPSVFVPNMGGNGRM